MGEENHLFGRVVAFLILPTSVGCEMEKQESVLDPSYNRIVLLFDESPCLLATYFDIEAFLLRSVRVWLCEKRYNNKRVVGVFAGTDYGIYMHSLW
jgi:hypothetical protein